jgi:hypothetical protein
VKSMGTLSADSATRSPYFPSRIHILRWSTSVTESPRRLPTDDPRSRVYELFLIRWRADSKGTVVEPARLGKELDVRLLLAGHVVQQGENLVVGAELIDTVREAQLWGLAGVPFSLRNCATRV